MKHFADFGTIVSKPRLFEGKNFCFIKYDTHDAATKAIVEGNGTELGGSVLKVRFLINWIFFMYQHAHYFVQWFESNFLPLKL